MNRIGVSIYNASELEGLPLDHLQLVQLPLSVYDQRLIRNSTIARAPDSGIAVHVRSVFLFKDCYCSHLNSGRITCLQNLLITTFVGLVICISMVYLRWLELLVSYVLVKGLKLF